MSSLQQGSDGYPQYWSWETDGLECVGAFVRLTEAPTQYGQKAIVVLDVGGVERSVWLNTTALSSKFAEELERRRVDDFNVGERIVVRRGAEKRESAAGRGYWPFVVEFGDAPKRSARAILGIGVEEPSPDDDPPQPGVAPAADEIPF